MGQKVLGGTIIMSLDWRTLNWLETRVDELIERGMTELEAITRMSGSDFRNIESFAKEVMPYLPKEYLES